MSKVPLTEPVVVAEVYIDGIARIEEMGENVKLDFFSYQRPVGAEYIEKVVVARFVMPKKAMSYAAMQALSFADTEIRADAEH